MTTHCMPAHPRTAARAARPKPRIHLTFIPPHPRFSVPAFDWITPISSLTPPILLWKGPCGGTQPAHLSPARPLACTLHLIPSHLLRPSCTCRVQCLCAPVPSGPRTAALPPQMFHAMSHRMNALLHVSMFSDWLGGQQRMGGKSMVYGVGWGQGDKCSPRNVHLTHFLAIGTSTHDSSIFALRGRVYPLLKKTPRGERTGAPRRQETKGRVQAGSGTGDG